jgi:hypothetical protein
LKALRSKSLKLLLTGRVLDGEGGETAMSALFKILLLLTIQPDLLSSHGEKAIVLLFVRSDCPISNRYAPELQRLYNLYSTKGVDFHLVYPEPGLTAAGIAKHRAEYSYTIPAARDEDHRYVALAQVRVTPEAAVFVNGQLVYHGRVDDRYSDLGKARPRPTSFDLEEVLAALVKGRKVPHRTTTAIGCVIERLR